MNKKYILVYDSGLGGLTTLKEILKKAPNENYLYFADDKNCPYGNKSREEIYEIVLNNLKMLFLKFNIKMVVFACNTATACCIDRLRGLYNIDFVGIEPAIKTALNESKNKKILVLCTKLTSLQDKYKKLSNYHSGDIITIGLESFAKEIEDCLIKEESLKEIKQIKDIEKCILMNEVECLVLGCTHYSYLKEIFSSRLRISVVDGNEGVARRVVGLLMQKSYIKEGGEVKIVLSSNGKFKAKQYERILNNIK